ncbi:response regulator [Ureibacillus aquaedulcis]|uniref:Transcriptional regulatory protein n=1 Tax=Ureibacillus aquaedulcis TaxID=3058421 RepID=A0ABT8GLS2_9BACL|nr:response regulator [Ureibacillus sp. BA0131]MDN4492365.1 response regulator [Ureibacillus sp. BA0131]
MRDKIEVLIVEDDKRIATIHQKFLSKIEGFECIGVAHSGEEAFEWIETVKPDLVLLDVYFPDLLGTEVLDYIKANSRETDIIFITAASESVILKKALRGGVVDYLLKPVTFEKFEECMETYRAKRRLLEKNSTLDEHEIKELWNMSKPIQINEITPKGIDVITNGKVFDYLQTYPEGITAEKLGKDLGLSRSTARRYLEYLVSENKVYTDLIYGTVGRPERRYIPEKEYCR